MMKNNLKQSKQSPESAFENPILICGKVEFYNFNIITWL